MDRSQLFETLKAILKPFETKLLVVHDKPDNYYLHTPATAKNIKGEFFGATQMKKNYVAFHLMPVYYHPELLGNISSELKKRMQGKSCFNFTTEQKNLFRELSQLTKLSFDKYKTLEKV